MGAHLCLLCAQTVQVTEAIQEAKGAKMEAVVELEKGADTVVRTHTPPAAWIALVMCLCRRNS